MTSLRVVFAPEAEAHLLSLYTYLAAEASPAIAETYTNRLIDFCETLAHFPERGLPRFDLRPSLRTIGYDRRATIAYFTEPGAVTIIGIFTGGQDYSSSLIDQ